MTLYGLYSPGGELLRVADNLWALYEWAFNLQDDEFQGKYWKKHPQSWNALRRNGWYIRRGTFYPILKEKP